MGIDRSKTRNGRAPANIAAIGDAAGTGRLTMEKMRRRASSTTVQHGDFTRNSQAIHSPVSKRIKPLAGYGWQRMFRLLNYHEVLSENYPRATVLA